MAEWIAPAIALLAAVTVGLFLYARYGQAGQTAVAIFGLIRNGTTFLIGIFLLMTGSWIGVVVGGLVIVLAIFLGSAHADNLGDGKSLRRRLAG